MAMLGSLPDLIMTRVDCARRFENNLKSLRVEMEKMMEFREDLLDRLADREEENMIPTAKVFGWLTRFETMKKEVDSILDQGEQQIQKRSSVEWTQYWWSAYMLGKEVITKLEALSKLKTEGDFNEDELATLKRRKVDRRPLPMTVGMDLIFERAWSSILKSSIIGIYGMGGVGKTTLLKRINNAFAEYISENGYRFDFVIWIEVSNSPNVGSIQDKIAEKLRLQNDTWGQRTKQEKAVEIFNLLINKHFVLLLDDLWDQHFDLQAVGIPPRGGSFVHKIIFTTRSEDVIGGMGADKRIKVGCLSERDAWLLFREKVGEEALYSQPQIRYLARLIAKECGGLPLALIIVGRAMASKKFPEEWRFTLNVLRKSASRFPNMENKVFDLLKFSYDSLADEITKACFLSCSLFPEGYSFYHTKMINIWMAEGFLREDGESYMVATQKGKSIIGELQRACLLESLSDELGCFKMHDLVRDMALWIYSEKGEQSDKYMVQERLNLTRPPPFHKLEAAKIISLRSNKIEILWGKPKCENLLTLDLSDNLLNRIDPDFFEDMPNLKVLYLSGSRVEELPRSLCKLTSLQFLDLSYTCNSMLPPNFQELRALKFLSLCFTVGLNGLHVLSRLSNLEQLELEGSRFNMMQQMLDDLECLEDLQRLTITMTTDTTLKKLLISEKLNKIIHHLDIYECMRLSLLQLSLLENNQVLESLRLEDCVDLEEVTVSWPRSDNSRDVCFCNLSRVEISHCNLLQDATWLMALPNLQRLEIRGCESMEEIIGVHGGEVSTVPANIDAFTSLESLSLRNLPMLKFICSHALSFPCLTTLHVVSCPRLKTLPFDSNYNAEKLSIIGEREWWDGLVWEDEAIRTTLNPKFRHRGVIPQT